MSIQIPYIIDETVVKQLPRPLARHYRIIAALKEEGDNIILLTDQDISSLEDELRMVLEFEFRLIGLGASEIDHLLQRYYYESESAEAERKVKSLAFDNNFLDSLIWEARQLKSSDIHIESFEDRGRIRIRIDGMMVERYSPS